MTPFNFFSSDALQIPKQGMSTLLHVTPYPKSGGSHVQMIVRLTANMNHDDRQPQQSIRLAIRQQEPLDLYVLHRCAPTGQRRRRMHTPTASRRARRPFPLPLFPRFGRLDKLGQVDEHMTQLVLFDVVHPVGMCRMFDGDLEKAIFERVGFRKRDRDGRHYAFVVVDCKVSERNRSSRAFGFGRMCAGDVPRVRRMVFGSESGCCSR